MVKDSTISCLFLSMPKRLINIFFNRSWWFDSRILFSAVVDCNPFQILSFVNKREEKEHTDDDTRQPRCSLIRFSHCVSEEKHRSPARSSCLLLILVRFCSAISLRVTSGWQSAGDDIAGFSLRLVVKSACVLIGFVCHFFLPRSKCTCCWVSAMYGSKHRTTDG